MIRPLTASDARATYTFLTRHGLRDVFLASKVHEGALSLPERSTAVA